MYQARIHDAFRDTYVIGFRVDGLKVHVALGTRHVEIFAKLRNLIFVCLVIRFVFVLVLLQDRKK